MTKKALDRKNRWRSKTISFRISPEENQLLEVKVKLSGLSKQDYIIHRCLEKEIVVYGNSRVHKGVHDSMKELLMQLNRIANFESLPPDFSEMMEIITMTLHGLMKGGVRKI
ncbi:MAG: hypothetical protein Q4G11_06035, partial [Gallicola sp.]|nr:hypothetical protein [Gallicola sp.]